MLDPDLTVTADVLDHALRMTLNEGYRTVGVDEIADRLGSSDGGRFAAFTFDDGYRDNLTVALPVFRAHRVPVCVYVTTGLIDRTAPCWWAALAHLVESRDQVDLDGLGLSDTHADGGRGRRNGRPSPASRPGCTTISNRAASRSGTGAATPASTNGRCSTRRC